MAGKIEALPIQTGSSREDCPRLPGEHVAAAAVPSDRIPILVIGEDFAARAYLCGILGLGYGIKEALDAESGHRMAVDLQVEVLICALDPCLDGISLCRQIKEDPRTNHLAVLLFADRFAGETRAAGWAAGVDGFLVPPLLEEEVHARIANLIRLRGALRARYRRELVLQPANLPVPSEQEAFLKRVTAALEAHLNESCFGVLELANELALSPRALHRKLKGLTQRGPGFWLRSFRLQRAAQLLRAGAGSVCDISQAVGYNDAHHFARLFRQKFGRSPSKYAAFPSASGRN